MKHVFFLTLVTCALTLASCKKNKPGNVSFTSAYDFTVTIPAQPEVPVIGTTLAVSSEININDDRLNNCDRASLRSFYIEIVDPDDQTFDFGQEIRLSLSAPGLPDMDVVSAANINPNARRIDFTVNDTDLAQYLRNDAMTVRLKVALRKGTSRAVKVYGNMVFNAQAGLIN